MARTESFSIQVHPKAEQTQIQLMQKFHWNLLGSQEIKVADSSLEMRGGDLYSVTKSEHYVKLQFSRELDLPNLPKIKQLEQQYNGLLQPKYPKLFPFIVWGWLFIWPAWPVYFFLMYSPKKKAADALTEQNTRKQNEIMNELTKYD